MTAAAWARARLTEVTAIAILIAAIYAMVWTGAFQLITDVFTGIYLGAFDGINSGGEPLLHAVPQE